MIMAFGTFFYVNTDKQMSVVKGIYILKLFTMVFSKEFVFGYLYDVALLPISRLKTVLK